MTNGRARLCGAWMMVAAAALTATPGAAAEARRSSSAAHRAAPAHRPIDRSGKVQTGVASYYGKPGTTAKTASGAAMNPAKLTAASRTLPLGTKARVINKENGRSTAVTITDRGPYAKNRILDVSRRAANQLGMKDSGVSEVQVVPVQEPPASAKTDPSTR